MAVENSTRSSFCTMQSMQHCSVGHALWKSWKTRVIYVCWIFWWTMVILHSLMPIQITKPYWHSVLVEEPTMTGLNAHTNNKATEYWMTDLTSTHCFQGAVLGLRGLTLGFPNEHPPNARFPCTLTSYLFGKVSMKSDEKEVLCFKRGITQYFLKRILQ